MKLVACTACDAFIPATRPSCPCCDAPRESSSMWCRATAMLRAAGGGAIAVTLMACYGAPPYNYEVVAPVEETEPDVEYTEEEQAERDEAARLPDEERADGQ